MKEKRLSPLSLGLALGIYWWVGLLIFWLTAWLRGYCKIFVMFMWTFYVWYQATFWGAIIGLLRWLVDGFVFGVILIWLYNFFIKKLK